MKYINQISFFMALTGIVIVVFTLSSTYLDQDEFEPIPVEPAEIDQSTTRAVNQPGFTVNRVRSMQPAINQIFTNRESATSERNIPASEAPVGSKRQPESTDIQDSRRARTVPQRYLNPAQNRPVPIKTPAQLEQEEPPTAEKPQSRGRTGLLAGGSGSRPAPPKERAASPFGTAVQKRDSSTNPPPPPPRGSMQQRPPQY